MNNQYKPNPSVNQHLSEDQSLTAAYMKNAQAQQEVSLKKPKKAANGNTSDYSDDMAHDRRPTYSNLYDAKLRTTSEYENPYDVSRRGTIAPGN